MKRFTKINETFTCQHCGHQNPLHPTSCRNHCQECLYSKHVDNNPGDRNENCHGLLKPIDIEMKSGIAHKIISKCLTCKKTRKNVIAEDDNREIMYKVMADRVFL